MIKCNRFDRRVLCVELACVVGMFGLVASTPARGSDETSQAVPYSSFYTQLRKCDGIAVRSSSSVDAHALTIACIKVERMLERMPVVRRNLVSWGAELHVIGRADPTSSLPELAHFRTEAFVDAQGRSTDLDQRARGVGGFFSACSEENLLGLASDRHHDGSDICTHEFAHTIMDVGLDRSLHDAIVARYRLAMQSGLWRGAYASTNPREYWADLSMWYFGSHGNRPPDRVNMPNGSEGLRDYDPAGFALLDSIYSGRRQPASVEIGQPADVTDDQGSQGGSEPARFVLINATSQPVDLFWVNPQGGTHAGYPKADPFRPEMQPTFVGHVWSVMTTSGQEIRRFRIVTESAKVVITP